jgi:hypothetical protein
MYALSELLVLYFWFLRILYFHFDTFLFTEFFYVVQKAVHILQSYLIHTFCVVNIPNIFPGICVDDSGIIFHSIILHSNPVIERHVGRL